MLIFIFLQRAHARKYLHMKDEIKSESLSFLWGLRKVQGGVIIAISWTPQQKNGIGILWLSAVYVVFPA